MDNWPPPYHREISYAEACATAGRLLPPDRYCTISTFEVECSECHHKYPIQAISTFVQHCPRCFLGVPLFPQLFLDLDPIRDARERAERALLDWPPIACRRDWERRSARSF